MSKNTPSRPGHKRSDFRNWLSLAGAVVALGSFFAFILLLLIDVLSPNGSNAYVGILTYIVSPAFLVLGLVLAVVGLRVQRQARLRAGGTDAGRTRFSINLSNPRDRRRLAWFGAATVVYLICTAYGSYQTYQITESVDFCGAVCHVMNPEYVTYQGTSHARVPCADCHVGSGADWYVKTKLNGVRQLYSLLLEKYSRPIPTPVHNLRPARDTCEQCHWPEKFTGSIVRSYNHYLADESNTPFTIRLMINVGGGSGKHTPADGIHWHITNKVEYAAGDDRLQVIPWVRVTTPDGASTVFKTDNFEGEPAPGAIRTMDCIDCHNRPSHRFKSPNDAVDEALYAGRIDRAIPNIKSTAVDLLAHGYATKAGALAAIEKGLSEKYAGQPGLEPAIAAVRDIYNANFFPDMKADWSQYPENTGHKDYAGCFRCHDSEHKAVGKADKLIGGSDCTSCHVILAQGSGAELSQLAPDGLEFKHPGGSTSGLQCNDCHTGKNQSE